MKASSLFSLAEKALNDRISSTDLYELIHLPKEQWYLVNGIAGWVKNSTLRDSIRLCAIVNAKSGLCDQDCKFCAQAYAKRSRAPVYPLISSKKFLKFAKRAQKLKATAFCIVTSGKSISGKDFNRACRLVESVKGEFLSVCASLGCLERSQLEELKSAGLRRYHHNLETSPSFYSNICTTRPYRENFQTLIWAKEAGLEVCAGGIFGLGESWKDRVELLMELKRAEVDSLSLNFLIPIKGTPLESREKMKPLEGLFCLALARLVHPKKHIIVCGGREVVLRDLQSAALISGASGIIVGNYLTQPGRDAKLDLEMISDLGLVPEN